MAGRLGGPGPELRGLGLAVPLMPIRQAGQHEDRAQDPEYGKARGQPYGDPGEANDEQRPIVVLSGAVELSASGKHSHQNDGDCDGEVEQRAWFHLSGSTAN